VYGDWYERKKSGCYNFKMNQQGESPKGRTPYKPKGRNPVKINSSINSKPQKGSPRGGLVQKSRKGRADRPSSSRGAAVAKQSAIEIQQLMGQVDGLKEKLQERSEEQDRVLAAKAAEDLMIKIRNDEKIEAERKLVEEQAQDKLNEAILNMRVTYRAGQKKESARCKITKWELFFETRPVLTPIIIIIALMLINCYFLNLAARPDILVNLRHAQLTIVLVEFTKIIVFIAVSIIELFSALSWFRRRFKPLLRRYYWKNKYQWECVDIFSGSVSDGRIDVHASAPMKHKNPQYALFKFQRPGWKNNAYYSGYTWASLIKPTNKKRECDKKKTQELYVSLELLSQISTLTQHSFSSDDVACERILNMAKHCATINMDRHMYIHIDGQDIARNTALLSYVLWKQRQERTKHVPFYRAG